MLLSFGAPAGADSPQLQTPELAFELPQLNQTSTLTMDTLLLSENHFDTSNEMDIDWVGHSNLCLAYPLLT
jgi:hypothetical protein